MKKVVILFLLATLLIAQNPTIYSALGNVIYDNVNKIEKLKNIADYAIYEKKIDTYVEDVYKTKDIGYAIEAGDKNLDNREYLQKLRELSKTNDFFHREVLNSFKTSMLKEDNYLFSKMLNSGLIDSDKYKSEILDYYFAHCVDMNASGVIQDYLDEDARLKEEEARSRKIGLSKKEIQERKIKRLREQDKAKQEKLHKMLEEELLQKKKEIRKEQVEELIKE